MGFAAADILNPTSSSDLNPDYGFVQQRPKSRVSYRPRASRPLERQLDSQPYVVDLLWQDRNVTVKDQLLQWSHKYEDNYFQLFDADTGRYYAGQFLAPLDITPTGFNKWTIRGVFEEVTGASMFQYPTNWANWAITIDEQNDWGDIVWGVQGTWTRVANGNAYGGFTLQNNGTVNTDFAKIQYFGYGFQLICATQNNMGQLAVYLDDVLIQAVLDLYSAAGVAAAPVLSYANVPIGLHTIKLQVLDTKNASSSGFFVFADAIQVMR